MSNVLDDGEVYCCVPDPNKQVKKHGRCCVWITPYPGWEMFGFDHDEEDSKEPDHKLRMCINRLCFVQMVILAFIGIAFMTNSYYSMSIFFVSDEYISDLTSTPDIKKELEFQRNQLLLEQENRVKKENAITDMIKSLTTLVGQNPSEDEVSKHTRETIKMIDDIIAAQEKAFRLSEKTAPVLTITSPITLLGCAYITIAFLTYNMRSLSSLEDMKPYIKTLILWNGAHVVGLVLSLVSRAGGYESPTFIVSLLIFNIFMWFFWNQVSSAIKKQAT